LNFVYSCKPYQVFVHWRISELIQELYFKDSVVDFYQLESFSGQTTFIFPMK